MGGMLYNDNMEYIITIDPVEQINGLCVGEYIKDVNSGKSYEIKYIKESGIIKGDLWMEVEIESVEQSVNPTKVRILDKEAIISLTQ